MKHSIRYLILALVLSFGFQSFASSLKVDAKSEQELKKKSKNNFISNEALKGIKKSLKKEKKQIKKSSRALKKNA